MDVAVEFLSTHPPDERPTNALLVLRAELLRRRGELRQEHLALNFAWAEGKITHEHDLFRVLGLFPALLAVVLTEGWGPPSFQRHQHAPKVALSRTLHLRTLGQVSLTLNGTPVNAVLDKALQALTYVLLEPGTQQDSVADALWSDKDLRRGRQSARSARQSLNTQIKALQTDLGLPAVPLIVSPGRGRENSAWTIAKNFELRCDAQDVLMQVDPAQVEQLYQGPFLPGNDSEWAAHWRRNIDDHVAAVLRQGMNDPNLTPRQSLDRLLRIARIDPGFQAEQDLQALALECRDPVVSRTAQAAISYIQQGEWDLLPSLRMVN
ncbi:hypothetical protein EHF33_15465 [Deinococcus psychrotolerans]|uniref:Bacterial transcriptional activator domain-containing protein n=1 Tax=Deinococcus psychrotolerans TaxID=2489213 RepID=A0A3G8YSS1_9DEIO|nr:hypothetical protein [Deinococcus psychrotolerans]AZI44286.1 hypothetical protein EHF33_15465 [Deinococcus psychrotolerans]